MEGRAISGTDVARTFRNKCPSISSLGLPDEFRKMSSAEAWGLLAGSVARKSFEGATSCLIHFEGREEALYVLSIMPAADDGSTSSRRFNSGNGWFMGFQIGKVF
jgi:hypothetical protein